jgi:D-alanyl-D-alanine carboxypeptidase
MTALALADDELGIKRVRVAAADPDPDTPAPAVAIATVHPVSVWPGEKPHGPLAPQSPAPPAVAATGRVPMRGIPASTLQRQAEQLGEAQSPEAVADPLPAAPRQAALAQLGAQPAYRLRGPDAPPAMPATPGGFEIQIGAYRSAAEAQTALAAARERATDLLAGATPATAPVRKGKRQLYRARFASFSASVAANTCLELRRRQIECFVRQPD